ncbi:heme/hemin ABC transporter substrate-binding protein [Chitinibacter tainanensis]|uniref:heme/hemin ABC transporter substrate-binding protein n=1 Tax=Chitinibacter tainanensis TaxID=230667 RepID=UPI00040B78FA|nr:ABC transporter substrate-binding protein [Chitinibacter tainanensis]
MRFVLSLWLLASALLLGTAASFAAPPQRVVSLGGPLTEIVYALGGGAQLVAVDQSSIYPAAAARLPKVGYYRQFSLEGVVAMKPDLVLASDQAGPPEAIEQLRRLGLRVVVLPAKADLESLQRRIYGVAGALQLNQDGKVLVSRLQRELAAVPKLAGQPRALVLISRTGQPEGAGKDTAADATLRLAGYRNVLAQQQGYKPLSAEAIAALKPEVIITSSMSLQSLGGLDKLLALPGLAHTSAAKQRKVLVLDDLLLLGFGPRLPEAIRALRQPALPAATAVSAP